MPRLAAMAATLILLAGCASAAPAPTQPASPTAAQTASPTQVASAASTASATASAVSTASSSASAACMDAATLDLLLHPSGNNFNSLTDAQITTIVAALRAYDFGSDTFALQWRDQIVADFEAHRLSDATQAMGSVVIGAVRLVACP
jgi:PBP1b-binding outer membrane lipoprotein LpoB